VDELKTGFQYYLENDFMSDHDFQEILKSVDTNNNGVIDYSEFIMSACNITSVLTKEKLKLAFDLFDLDSNGVITPYELKSILTSSKNQELVDDEWDRLVSEFDANGDGTINFDEF
jgi:calcium-dependent protein kinase